MLIHLFVLVALENLLLWFIDNVFGGCRGDGEDDDVQFDPNSFMQSMQKIFGLSLIS